jgi:hypothetical protein
MARTKTSPHHSYKTPLMAAMMALTGGKANVKVKNADASEKACEIMGVAIDAHGKQAQTGQWWTVRWCTLAMLELKQAGLMDFPTKGWWVLTQAGVDLNQDGVDAVAYYSAEAPVAAPVAPAPTPVAPVAVSTAPVALTAAVAAALAVAAPVVVPAPEAPAPVVVTAPVSTAPVPAPVPAKGRPKAVATVPVATEEPAEEVDPYLITVQMQATKCFSHWSADSSQCKGCPLATKCYRALLAVLSGLADTLPLVADPTPVAMPAPPAPVVPEVPVTAPAGYIEMAVAADTVCIYCQQGMPKGTTGAYARKKGFSHLDCARKAEGAAA